MKRKILACLMAVVMLMGSLGGPGYPEAEAAEVTDYKTLAVNLPLNGAWSAEKWLTSTHEEDWYKIVIPADGMLSLKIMAYFKPDWTMYDNEMANTITDRYWDFDGANEVAPVTENYSYSLSKGTYYLSIHGGEGRYKIAAAFENYNVNDQNAISYDSAQNLAPNVTVTGALTETDREDWYKISVPRSGYYSFTIKSYFALDWTLYDSEISDTIIQKSYGFDGASETKPVTEYHDQILTAGTYYIKISSETGKYYLTWSALTQANCPHDYESSTVGATYTALGYTLHKCKKCGKYYQDEYQPKKKLGQVSLSSYYSRYKKKLKISWYSVTDASGYQIRYTTDRKMKRGLKVVKTRNTYKTIKKLKRRKKYYIKVRAYRKEAGTTVYGKWSVKGNGKTL